MIGTRNETTSRRNFFKHISAGAAGLALGSIYRSSESSARTPVPDNSQVSFVTGTDQREAAYLSLKPLEKEIRKAIQDKQVVIKVNMGQVRKDWWLNATDANQVRGILDFLKPIYDKKVIVAESTAAGATSTMEGFENYNYMPILKEYNVKFTDLNDEPTFTQWIKGENHHPLALNIIGTFLDPNVYLISATRLKSHNCVIATLSLKNVAMASPINHYQQKSREGRNEKPLMHSGGNRGLSYNMFLLATMGVRPDLAVLDGVVGMEGNGPVNGTPVEQGVALASTDWLAADRLGVEMMGMDYSEVKYLQWCSAAGMGQDDLSKIKITGPDYKKHITKYKLHENIDKQREWLVEDFTDKG
ncbi:MAG: DUF362 domain-containing protein [Candidatus Latescibacteria bacterium]|nr:DUF362 domain-containing protein [Candidatus Latescibacterota bacterium]